MKKIAIALAIALSASSAFAQAAIGTDVTNLAPANSSATAVAGNTVVIAGVGTATWVAVGGVLLLILVAGAGGGSSSSSS